MNKQTFMKMVLGGLGWLIFVPAFAASDYVLSYSAQDLQSQESVANLHARIVKTARQSCPSYQTVRDLAEIRNCRQEVADDLVSKVGSPELTNYHRGGDATRIARSGTVGADRS